ncbi:unnamed protein product, partial [Mesorhabditis belari]|uniref:E3 ubiquitin-protein ligase n=1 Tax=Mesorhabditis belari TaxID=2138241 RepID=A0AAF3J3G2_9BILA
MKAVDGNGFLSGPASKAAKLLGNTILGCTDEIGYNEKVLSCENRSNRNCFDHEAVCGKCMHDHAESIHVMDKQRYSTELVARRHDIEEKIRDFINKMETKFFDESIGHVTPEAEASKAEPAVVPSEVAASAHDESNTDQEEDNHDKGSCSAETQAHSGPVSHLEKVKPRIAADKARSLPDDEIREDFDDDFTKVVEGKKAELLKLRSYFNEASMFPCKFSNSGCGSTFHRYDKAGHEEACEFRPYSCPCPGAVCRWQGALQEVMPHLIKIHKSFRTLQGEDIVFLATDINLTGAVDWVMMQSCFGYHFLLVLEKQEKSQQPIFYAVVQLIGAKKEAENFKYRLELSTCHRRLVWEAKPRSIHEGVAHAISQSDCLAFDTQTAQLFAENGNLGINVTITQLNAS